LRVREEFIEERGDGVLVELKVKMKIKLY